MMNWIVAFSLLLGCILSSHAALRDVIGICCDRGRQYAAQDGVCTDLEFFPFFDIQETDRQSCIHLSIGCCDNEIQQNLCAKGIGQRANQGSCKIVEGDDCYSVEKDCCNCCELGLEAYHAGAPCEITTLGEMCNLAFQTCCQRAFNDGDVDECTIPLDFGDPFNGADGRCSENCVNIIGDYKCECDNGLVLDSDGYSCVRPGVGPTPAPRPTAAPVDPGRPADPCDTAPCTQACRSNAVTYQCACRQGYVLNDDQVSCRVETGKPVDPCEAAPCTQECRSNAVTYQCTCRQGYLLNEDQASCRDENECVTGYYQCNPGEGCVNTEGGYRCQPGAHCTEPGYQFDERTRRCQDVNECQTDPNICELHQECINYDGHYYCNTLCSQGYQVIMDDRGGRHACEDVDECALSLHNCADGQRCDNLPGGFRCTRTVPCGTGYTINGNNQKCEDVDECAQNLHDCNAYYLCNNTLGSYRCEPCPPGFRVAPSNVCNIDINECDDPNICQPGSRCDNTYGSFRCSSLCARGLEYVAYLSRCMDIDECARGVHSCTANQVCKNTMGGFSCQCKDGFNYNYETQLCNDIDECQEGDRLGRPKCRPHERCENVGGSHRCTPACPFGQKFQRFGSIWNCTDINECLYGTHNCRGDEICVNDAYNGTYRCIRCTRGTIFNAVAKTCDDIDECNNPSGRVCLGICNNNPGSFYCTCPTGYNMIQSRVCRDIDECQVGIHRCRHDQLCFNTKGSHRCMNLQCPRYYNKRITGRQMRCDKIQRQLCPPTDQDFYNCAGNRTSPIIYFPLSLRSYPDLPQEQDVLTLRIPAPSNIIEFVLSYGNERGIFEVEKRQAGQTEGVLRLVSPVTGPYQTEVHMAIRTNTAGSRYEPKWEETSKAIIMVDVSPFDF